MSPSSQVSTDVDRTDTRTRRLTPVLESCPLKSQVPVVLCCGQARSTTAMNGKKFAPSMARDAVFPPAMRSEKIDNAYGRTEIQNCHDNSETATRDCCRRHSFEVLLVACARCYLSLFV